MGAQTVKCMFETAGKIKFQANLKSKVDRVNTHGKVVYIYIKSEFSVIFNDS